MISKHEAMTPEKFWLSENFQEGREHIYFNGVRNCYVVASTASQWDSEEDNNLK
jgi:hypothetical protein